MIDFHPIPAIEFDCPVCSKKLTPFGWYMPGMRVLAKLECIGCGRHFYGDLPTGQGILQPVLLDAMTGQAYGVIQSWFVEELSSGYANRTDKALDIAVEQMAPLRNPYVLNCLDSFYGHCLEKLFNVQHYIDKGADILVIVPAFLRWLVPEGVAEIWSVKIPLRKGAQWNDDFAMRIQKRLETLDHCALAIAFPEPHPGDYQIERFTRVKPFDTEDWLTRMVKPAVTFIWRPDRLWDEPSSQRWLRGLKKIGRSIGILPSQLQMQARKVQQLAENLRQSYPTLDFAVVGLGESGGFAPWILDMRTLKIDDAIEQNWCLRYANSHLVIGVHGSNMLLPSALAGSVLEILPTDRDSNLGQDIITAEAITSREVLYLYRLFPLSTSVTRLSKAARSILQYVPVATLQFNRKWNNHQIVEENPKLHHELYKKAMNQK